MASQQKAPEFNENESPVLRLYMRKSPKGERYLCESQFRAAEMLRRDFEASHLSPRLTASYGAGVGKGDRHFQFSDNHIANLTDKALAARERLHQAFTYVGPELGGILYQVCCLAGGLENAERVLALPSRSGKAVLALALKRLVAHYRLPG
jgi:hypothetical protein